MFIKLQKRRAQGALEYAVLLAIIVAAIVVMQVYIKRGLMGKFKESSDDIGEQADWGHHDYNSNTVSASAVHETVVKDGTTTQDVQNQNTTRNRTLATDQATQTDWGVPQN